MLVELILPAVLTTGLVGLTASVILVVVSRIFHVQEDPLVEQVTEALPGANCGGCGFAGCKAFAEALVKTRDTSLTCPVCSKEATAAIGALLGVELSGAAPQVAALRCNGTEAKVVTVARYDGVEDCHAAVLLHPSHKACSYGCLGLGTCVRACPFDAIHMRADGIVEIDEEACTGCKTCVAVCPKELLVMVPKGERVAVACANRDKAGDTRKACSVGCIACRKCVKACNDDAVQIVDNLARIDQDKCTHCQACVSECPNDCILTWHLAPPAAPAPAEQSEEQSA